MILVLGNFAGVFSNLLKLVNWSFHCKDEDLILFYYTNKKEYNEDSFSVPFLSYGGDLSRIIFYKYFQYPTDCSLETFLEVSDLQMGYPPASVFTPSISMYFEPTFPEVRQLYYQHINKRLIFTPYMNSILEKELSVLGEYQKAGKKIMAVFLRFTGFLNEVNPLESSFSIDNYFQELHSMMKDYDYILPITQIRPFFEKTKQEFQEKCISFPRDYLDQNEDWKKVVSDEEFEEEFKLAIQDVYLASQCDFIVGRPSNMLLGSLFFNPNVPFYIVQTK